eukprot:642025-Pyramimonas_sp.AAC.1
MKRCGDVKNTAHHRALCEQVVLHYTRVPLRNHRTAERNLPIRAAFSPSSGGIYPSEQHSHSLHNRMGDRHHRPMLFAKIRDAQT